MVQYEADWTLLSAAQPIAWAFSFCGTSLAIGCFPELGRWNGLLLLLAPASGALFSSPNLSPYSSFNDTYSRFVIILFSYMAALCFMPDGRVSGTRDKAQELDTSWRAGWKRACNGRGIGMAWENAYLWPEQKSTVVFAERSCATSTTKTTTYKDKPVEVEAAPPSRHRLATRGKWSAVLIHLGYMLLNYMLMNLYYEYRVSATVGGFVADDLLPEKEGILRRLYQQSSSSTGQAVSSPITSRELQIRLLFAANKFIPDVLRLSAFHDLLAAIFIATGVDQPWEWPPLFGPLTEAYSMRRFWSRFWHRAVYKSFNFHAATLTKALGIPQGTAVSRILNNWLVFVLSAVMHGTVTWLYGGKCAWGRGTMVFWCIQPVAFVLEGLVQHEWKQNRKAALWWANASVVAAFERLVGYAWVVAWLVWCAPKPVFAFRSCPA